MAMVNYPTKTKRGYFKVAENYWRKTCCFTHQAFLKARAELQGHEAIKTRQYGLNKPQYQLSTPVQEVKSYLMIAWPIVHYLGELLEHKLLNRATGYLYFHLYSLAFQADFPESIFLRTSDMRQSLGHPSSTLCALIAKLKALGLVEVNAAKTCHSPSEFFIAVPDVKYPPRENRREIQLATDEQARAAVAKCNARLAALS